MRNDLMDKEVLCILDTRQIQRYIFRTNAYLDALGGSDMLTHILDDAIFCALNTIDPPLSEEEYDISTDPDAREIPFFTSEKVQFQLISSIAGNALFLCRSGALCQKIIRKTSRYYLEHGYSLNLAAAITEKTNNLQNDTSALYEQLDRVKASGEIADPSGALPVAIREKETGAPAVARDSETGEYLSTAALLMRAEAKKRPVLISMQDMKPMKTANGKDYLAVIHADGNNVGITIAKLLAEAKSYEESIRLRRRISRDLNLTFNQAVGRSIEQLKAAYLTRHGEHADFDHAFQLSHQAGDDINCICSADLAIPFLNLLYENLKGKFLWKTESQTIPIYIGAGIAFVPPQMTFHDAFCLAEDCCESAKTVAKKESNLRNGLAGNWMDFQVVCDDNAFDLETQREHAFVTKENINLLLRPYSFDPEAKDEIYAFDALLERAVAVKNLALNESQKKILSQSYVMGRMEFRQWVQTIESSGTDLSGILGNPLYKDDQKQLHAVWFDATELSTFV